MEEKNGYFHQFKKKHCNYILSHTYNSVQYSKWDVNVIRSLYRKVFPGSALSSRQCVPVRSMDWTIQRYKMYFIAVVLGRGDVYYMRWST